MRPVGGELIAVLCAVVILGGNIPLVVDFKSKTAFESGDPPIPAEIEPVTSTSALDLIPSNLAGRAA